MITFKRILVPTDFSENSEVAGKYARAMAEAFHADLHLMHVLEEPYVTAVDPASFVPAPSFYEEIETETRARLVRLLADWEPLQPHVEIVSSRGSPFVEILRYAKEHGIDLIVLGTHGRGPIAHMLMGSVAETIVRKAPCPVLTVRHPQA
ncbi:MAG: universal stress protein [Planctomycetaceae bacterium]|nr:universal stress protein [Planctomycetaceae bacterium]